MSDNKRALKITIVSILILTVLMIPVVFIALIYLILAPEFFIFPGIMNKQLDKLVPEVSDEYCIYSTYDVIYSNDKRELELSKKMKTDTIPYFMIDDYLYFSYEVRVYSGENTRMWTIAKIKLDGSDMSVLCMRGFVNKDVDDRRSLHNTENCYSHNGVIILTDKEKVLEYNAFDGTAKDYDYAEYSLPGKEFSYEVDENDYMSITLCKNDESRKILIEDVVKKARLCQRCTTSSAKVTLLTGVGDSIISFSKQFLRMAKHTSYVL